MTPRGRHGDEPGADVICGLNDGFDDRPTSHIDRQVEFNAAFVEKARQAVADMQKFDAGLAGYRAQDRLYPSQCRHDIKLRIDRDQHAIQLGSAGSGCDKSRQTLAHKKARQTSEL
jgi:hypothetical protein